MRESHPAKDEEGDRLYDFLIENLMVHGADKPQTVNLLPLLESIFADEEKDPDVSELKNIFYSLSSRMVIGTLGTAIAMGPFGDSIHARVK